jgi:hypothetical protein
MSEKYKFHDPHGMYFVTMAPVGARLQRVPLLVFICNLFT